MSLDPSIATQTPNLWDARNRWLSIHASIVFGCARLYIDIGYIIYVCTQPCYIMYMLRIYAIYMLDVAALPDVTSCICRRWTRRMNRTILSVVGELFRRRCYRRRWKTERGAGGMGWKGGAGRMGWKGGAGGMGWKGGAGGMGWKGGTGRGWTGGMGGLKGTGWVKW